MASVLREFARLTHTKPVFRYLKRRFSQAGPDEEQSVALMDNRYNQLTIDVMGRVLQPDSNCVDVGAHVGSLLSHMVTLAPEGRHFAFEPLPDFARDLRQRFPGVEVVEAAAAEAQGTATFRYVSSDPGFSSLARLPYNPMDEKVTPMTVQTVRLDDALPPELPIRFIKVDVNGGEIAFFEGATRTLSTWKPFVAFELGWGPEEVYA
ncbi:MAG TPA: FkbM family methyltransferase, partial [Acidimicrobiales bacterium]